MSQQFESVYGGTKAVAWLIILIGGLVIVGGMWGAAASFELAQHDSALRQLAGIGIGFSALGSLAGLLLVGAGHLVKVTADIASCNREILRSLKAAQASS